VKDQGQCGACYAHSTSSQMEAQLAIATNTVPVPLSREQLKDCSTGLPGCGGGSPYNMFLYAAAAAGLGTEAAFPYVASNAPCAAPLPAKSFVDTGSNSIAATELAFKAGLANGPIAVTVCATTWSNYAGGVLNNCGSSSTCSVDHAVLLVGYGVDATLGPYWLIQNSWNTWWGESGFIRIPRTDSGTTGVGACGLTRYVGYQATGSAGGAAPGSTPCQGTWGTLSACSKTCGGGTQSKTWTTSAQPTGSGTPCPNPLTQTLTCNTALCPTPGGGGTTATCLTLKNTVLGANGDGTYTKVADWNQAWCGSTTNPQYTMTKNGVQLALFFYATSCTNNVKMSGLWGLGPAAIPRQAYQWSNPVTIPTTGANKGVIPGPDVATGWTIQFSSC